MMSLSEIKTEVDRRAGLIGAAGHRALPTYGHTQDGARPRIEVDSRGYHFVVVERGQEQERFTTPNLDDLLFRIFQSVTHELAFAYELVHRVEMQDCRRLAFRRQVELLSQLSPNWAEREAQGQSRILTEHPFDDMASIRASLTRELKDAGYSPQTAWQMAGERYPLPAPA
jgi:immunity protein 63 of polymorphic toxin system